MRKNPLKITQFFTYGLVLFVLQEIIFRICFPLPELRNFNKTNYLPKFDQELSIRKVWYERAFYQSEPDTSELYLHKFNGYGFRDKEWKLEKVPGKPRLLFVGDSFVEGAMAAQSKNVTGFFEGLSGSGKYDIINLGMIGVGMESYFRVLNDAIPTFKPDVIFLLLYSNDVPVIPFTLPLNTFVPEPFPIYEPRLFALVKIIMAGESLPLKWKAPTQLIPAVPSPFNPWTSSGAQVEPHVRPDLAKSMRAGKFNPFHINWVLKEEHFLKQEIDFSPYITALSQFATKNDSKLVICYIPSRNQVSTYYYPFELATCQKECPPSLDLTQPIYHRHRRHLKGICYDLKIPFIDLTVTIKNHEERGNHLYWNYDDHLREKGYEVIAAEIHSKWRGSLTD